jgi:modulator of FtsH protease HflC
VRIVVVIGVLALVVGGAKETARRRASTPKHSDFYAFLRTMEASRSVVRKGTTMVLPADSPLFGVLFDSNFSGVACRG